MGKKIIVDKIGKRFGDFWAVNGVRANIWEGKITAFIGPNGAGKTTLFQLLAGELKPDAGRVLFNETDISRLAAWKIARMGIGRQFQDVRIFGGLSVLENVFVALLTPREQSPIWSWENMWRQMDKLKKHKTKAKYWLEFVGLSDHHACLAQELSFGQQKLLSIARLMAGGFDVFLLDEPTAGLSHAMVNRIVSLLNDLVEKHGVTIGLIEHNMTVVASLAYWIYFMNEGSVAFHGRSDHVLGNDDVREIYMGL
jgi:ABC-type branched-subunit amino acid transport system ATPase component